MLISLHIHSNNFNASTKFDREGLCQLQNGFVTDKDLHGRNVVLALKLLLRTYVNITLVTLLFTYG